MVARNVSLHLKPNSVGEFTRVIDKEIIPLLRKQKGFQDEIMFVASGGLQAVGISLWDEEVNADAYDRKIYPTVMKALVKFLEGTPRIQTYEVTNSTFHKIAMPVSA